MIRSLILRNAGPFRGEHHLELGPKAYALTARYEADGGRSNWAGKSFLLEMVKYALTGDLTKSRRYDADGWLTEGEREGAVSIVLEGGVAIKRERKRGKPTQVTFSNAAGEKASQADADVAMLRHLAFAAEDFETLAYFEQGMMSRLVRTEPEKRFDIVRGWLGLEKAEDAEERVGKVAAAAMRGFQQIRAKRDAVKVMLTNAEEPADVEKLTQLRDAMQKNLDLAAAAQQRQQGYREQERTVAAFDELIEVGKRVSEELSQIPEDISERASCSESDFGDAAARFAELDRDVVRKKKVALGQFDGKCPVASGLTCPVRAEINADRSGSTSALEDARRLRDEAEERYEKAKAATAEIRMKAASALSKRQDLDRIRERATELQPEAKAARKELKGNTILDAAFDVVEIRRVHAQAVQAIADAGAERRQKEKLEADLLVFERELEEAAKVVGVAVAARSVFRATQRRVAERALDQIGARAGAMMTEAGIDLSVKIRWEREGKNPARACDLCGAAFPASAKVKECADCGAERGMNVVQRLEFLLSNRSGAADDLAGVALQLAAGDWLLRARSSPWACAMMDEPLAACDKTNRRALAGQLVKLVGAGTFRQAIIVSHSPDVVDMYPGRIEVVVARDGTRRIFQS